MKKIDFIKVCNDLDKSGFYKSSDKLEQLVDDSKWPLPKFRELLFLK